MPFGLAGTEEEVTHLPAGFALGLWGKLDVTCLASSFKMLAKVRKIL